ncbi:TPA: hypothetical protein TZ697_000244 [Streptococcus suis]|nr:hypothetical protein [Streptococcus suis]
MFAVGMISKLKYILSTNVNFDRLFDTDTFEIGQPLDGTPNLYYRCQFQDFERAEYLHLKAKQADETENLADWLEWIEKLHDQQIEILNVELR